MTNSSKKALDLLCYADIEKIQAEIEKDLEKSPAMPEPIQVPIPAAEPVLFEPAPYESAPPDFVRAEAPDELNVPDMPESNELLEQLIAPDFEPNFEPDFEPNSEQNPFADSEADISPTGGFYQEIHKPAPFMTAIPEKRHPRLFKSWRSAIALLLVCTLGTGSLGFGLSAAWVFLGPRGNGAEYVYQSGGVNSITLTSRSYIFESVPSGQGAKSLPDIVERLEPSVVGITTYRADHATGTVRAAGMGSGIIFAESDDRIFIVTNRYIIRGAARVYVSISGSEPLRARSVGSYIDMDLNIMSVYKADLVRAGIDSFVIAAFGNSGQMRVGDTVLAIGNAMGEGNSVTRGVVSATDMSISLRSSNESLNLTVLQTDAAINYGSSGGPLINTKGEVIGININRASDIIFGMTQVEGMAYSIPADIAAPILYELVNRPHAAIGIEGQTINEEIAAYFGIPALGVRVRGVAENRPAYRAGILPNDVITGFNGQPIFDMAQLQQIIRASEIGSIAEVRVLRNGTDIINFNVQLDALLLDVF